MSNLTMILLILGGLFLGPNVLGWLEPHVSDKTHKALMGAFLASIIGLVALSYIMSGPGGGYCNGWRGVECN
jgi:hypothetical protein